MKAEKKLA